MLGWARESAIAEIDLARVRTAKISLIERYHTLGALGPPRLFRSDLHAVKVWADRHEQMGAHFRAGCPSPDAGG